MAKELRGAYERGKPHAIVVVAEGARYNAEGLVRYFKENGERLGFEVRTTILGHLQRGGVPTGFDRLSATRLGTDVPEALSWGEHGVLVGLLKGEIATTPLDVVASNKKPLDLRLIEWARVLENSRSRRDVQKLVNRRTKPLRMN